MRWSRGGHEVVKRSHGVVGALALILEHLRLRARHLAAFGTHEVQEPNAFVLHAGVGPRDGVGWVVVSRPSHQERERGAPRRPDAEQLPVGEGHGLDVELKGLEDRAQKVFRVLQEAHQVLRRAPPTPAAEAHDRAVEHVGALDDRGHRVRKRHLEVVGSRETDGLARELLVEEVCQDLHLLVVERAARVDERHRVGFGGGGDEIEAGLDARERLD
mmetsp:Transcript_59539/g.141566  ORF Transcript_59539/g.141566 Transcript_59539/m.141566 type:complete len:216 (-) Transcript_59539:1696-2343(-)